MNTKSLSLIFLGLCWAISMQPIYAQHGYEASWHAGLMGVHQNPAAIATAPYKSAFLLGSINVSANNTYFKTNELAAFSPFSLLGNIDESFLALPFLSEVQAPEFYTTEMPLVWNAKSHTHFQAFSGFWRMKTHPDLIEKGIIARVFALRLGREELSFLNGLDPRIGEGYAIGFAHPRILGLSLREEYFHLRHRAWDTFTANFALSLGKGNKLLHMAVGAKLLHVGSFMDVKAYGSLMDFSIANTFSLTSDSVSFAYNPSFAEASRAEGKRRYGNFENSWGVAGEIGIIYQVLNIDRLPKLEIGASVQNLGKVQFWNLQHQTYKIRESTTDFDTFTNLNSGAEGVQSQLATMASDTLARSDGITETLPVILTTHAKLRLGHKGWGLHLRGDFRKFDQRGPWQSLAQLTFSYEREKASLFFPISTVFRSGFQTAEEENKPRVGLFISLFKEVCVIGSNDFLSNMVYSSIREGVVGSHVFIGVHFPIDRDN